MNSGVLSNVISGFPVWLQVSIEIIAWVVAAAIVGAVIGKLFAMVKYPDPEKNHIVPPIVQVGFIVVLAACCIWLYISMQKTNNPTTDVYIEQGMSEGMEDGAGGAIGGGANVGIGGAIAMVG